MVPEGNLDDRAASWHARGPVDRHLPPAQGPDRDRDYFDASFGHLFGGRSIPALRNVSPLQSRSITENRDAHFRKLRQTTAAVLARFLEDELGAERLSEDLLQNYLRTAPASDAGWDPVADAARRSLSAAAPAPAP